MVGTKGSEKSSNNKKKKDREGEVGIAITISSPSSDIPQNPAPTARAVLPAHVERDLIARGSINLKGSSPCPGVLFVYATESGCCVGGSAPVRSPLLHNPLPIFCCHSPIRNHNHLTPLSSEISICQFCLQETTPVDPCCGFNLRAVWTCSKEPNLTLLKSNRFFWAVVW